MKEKKKMSLAMQIFIALVLAGDHCRSADAELY